MDTTEVTDTTPQMVNPFEKAIAIEVKQHRLGTRRKVRENEAQVTSNNGGKVNQNAVSINKTLCKAREFDAIVSLDNKLRSDLEAFSVPAMLAESTVLVPFGLVSKAREIIRVYLERRPVLVKEFLDFYTSGLLEKEKERLGELYRRDQYPAPGDVDASFFVEVRYRSFGVPGELKSVDQAAYEEALAGVRDEMAQATSQIRSAMREGLLKLVAHLRDRLTATQPSGKPGKLYDSAVVNLREWVSLFDARNLTNDAQLRELVEQCKGVLEGTTVEELRENVDLRAVVAQALDPVNEALTGLVSEAPTRIIDLGD